MLSPLRYTKVLPLFAKSSPQRPYQCARALFSVWGGGRALRVVNVLSWSRGVSRVGGGWADGWTGCVSVLLCGVYPCRVSCWLLGRRHPVMFSVSLCHFVILLLRPVAIEWVCSCARHQTPNTANTAKYMKCARYIQYMKVLVARQMCKCGGRARGGANSERDVDPCVLD